MPMRTYEDFPPETQRKIRERATAGRYRAGVDGVIKRLRERIAYASEAQLDEIRELIDSRRES